jgi:hypothetical protein
MDAFTLVISIVPLMIGIVFSAITIMDVKEMFAEKTRSVLTPVWCAIAGLSWIFFGIVSIYGDTSTYLYSLGYFFMAIGLLFFPILFFVTIFQSITLSGKEKEANEMRLE